MPSSAEAADRNQKIGFKAEAYNMLTLKNLFMIGTAEEKKHPVR